MFKACPMLLPPQFPTAEATAERTMRGCSFCDAASATPVVVGDTTEPGEGLMVWRSSGQLGKCFPINQAV